MVSCPAYRARPTASPRCSRASLIGISLIPHIVQLGGYVSSRTAGPAGQSADGGSARTAWDDRPSSASDKMTLQMAYFDRYREPVAVEISPVLDLEGVARGKVCALASRIEPRDNADTGRMLERYGPAQLIGFARRLDPGLTARDYVDGGRQLDQIDDEAFARYRLDPRDVATLRERFAARPPTAGAPGKETRAGGHGNRQPQPGQAHAAPDPETNLQ